MNYTLSRILGEQTISFYFLHFSTNATVNQMACIRCFSFFGRNEIVVKYVVYMKYFVYVNGATV